MHAYESSAAHYMCLLDKLKWITDILSWEFIYLLYKILLLFTNIAIKSIKYKRK